MLQRYVQVPGPSNRWCLGTLGTGALWAHDLSPAVSSRVLLLGFTTCDVRAVCSHPWCGTHRPVRRGVVEPDPLGSVRARS